MGRHFYGAMGEKILQHGTPALVRITLPEEASGLLYRPWELGYIQGKPLALQDVSLIFEPPGEPEPVAREPVGERLRILAVFSLPTDAGALNLRQERYELAQTVRGMAGAIDLRVLQYGVTRDLLGQILEEGEGWDVVHFSGHGLAAHLVLETPDGTRDIVPSGELVKLLRPARGRLKWVTLSACLSAAATVNETLAWLGVEPKRGEAGPAPAGAELQAVARALVESLDCAVLAMRYPVGDRFAIDLGRGLLERVLEKGQPLARALQLTLPAVLDGPEVEASAVATPTLFGRYAAQLALEVPEGEAPVRLGMSYFRKEPDKFVGRVGLLARARAALAPMSGCTGVLFHGMSGGGKTSCALELAYQYQDIDRFQRFLWWEAPKGDSDISAALIGFARQWDIQVDAPEVPLTAMANADDAKFAASLPRLSRYLEQRRVLIVLDNLESLLRENGQWRDERWGKLLAALVNHRGRSRVVLTSRIRPQPLDARVPPLAVHSLSLEEAALLARQSKNLCALLRDPQHRDLVIETLRLVQGHPELLKLAEAQAASPEVLAAHLKRAREAQTAGAAELEAFFRTGESTLDPDGFLGALYLWTKSVAGTLSEGARALFYRLCCMEEEDREEAVIRLVWGEVTAQAAELMAAGLVDAAYRIHPGVAEAGRREAGPGMRDSVDNRMAAFWSGQYEQALAQEDAGMGGTILRAGRSAVPYLMRQGRQDEAQTLLEQVIRRDQSSATVAEVLPVLRRIAEETRGTDVGLRSGGVYARALEVAGRAGESLGKMREVERQAVELGRFGIASVAAGYQADMLSAAGHYKQALETLNRKKDYTAKAELGPWSRLSDEIHGLLVLLELGRYQEVLDTVQTRRQEVVSWPASSGMAESADRLNVLEVLVDAGRAAALGLLRWEEALSLTDEVVKLMERRGATKLDLQRGRFNRHTPMLRLRRYDETRALLYECLAVFESAGGSAELGLVHGALADLEDDLHHFAEAVRHQSIALRYSYATLSPNSCAADHFSFAGYLSNDHGPEGEVLAHRIASALIRYRTEHGSLANALLGLRKQLARTSPGEVPAGFDQVCAVVERTEGVRFRELFERLPRRDESGDEALRTVLGLARGAAPADPA